MQTWDESELIGRAIRAYLRWCGSDADHNNPNRAGSRVVNHADRVYVVLGAGHGGEIVFRLDPRGILRRLERAPRAVLDAAY